MTTQHLEGRGHERVPVSGSPRRRGDPTTGLRDAIQLLEEPDRVPEIHDDVARNGSVKARGGEGEIGDFHFLKLDVGEAPLIRSASRDPQAQIIVIDPDDSSCWAHDVRDLQRRITESGPSIEDAHPRPNTGGFDQRRDRGAQEGHVRSVIPGLKCAFQTLVGFHHLATGPPSIVFSPHRLYQCHQPSRDEAVAAEDDRNRSEARGPRKFAEEVV